MKRFTTVMLLLGMLLCGIACDKRIEGEYWPNHPPLVYLSSGPMEGAENINYKVHFYWNGYDPDGNIDYFQYLITDDEVTGSLLIDEDIYKTLAAFALEDENGVPILDDFGEPIPRYTWTNIAIHDSAFVVSADSIPDPEQNSGDEQYFYGQDHFLFRAQHTFFIRSVDEQGLHSRQPEHVTFTASTIAPEVKITEPQDTGVQGGYEQLPTDIFFRWAGNDSVGDGSIIEPDFTRWTLLNRGDFGIDLDESGSMLDLPENIWKNWLAWGAIDSTDDENAGSRTLLRNLTSSDTGDGGEYLFFVQAKDEAGAVTSHFTDGVNLKKMRIVSNLQPSILVREASLGTRFSRHSRSYSFSIAEGQQLDLSWSADASEYGSRISGFRFGWDILDTNNDEEWSSWSSAHNSATATHSSGTHVFYLEASDFSGTVTRLTFHFLIVPFTMENDLLLIDDFDNDAYDTMSDPPGYPGENIATLYLTSDMMNQRWRSLLAEYDGFEPDRDFVKITPVVYRPPFQIVAAYAHLIWEVKESDSSSGLSKVSRFVDPYVTEAVPYDYFSSYLERGGQALLCGYPASTLMPVSAEMDPNNYERRMPLCFAKHFSFSQGSQSEFTTAIDRFLLVDKFAVTTVEMNSNSSPRDVPFTGADYKHGRTFWGMRYARWLGDEAASVFNMESPPAVGDSLRFSPLVYEWFDAAGPEFCINYEAPGGELRIDYGLRNVEIYDWAWLAQVYTPPIEMPRNYYPLLGMIPSDSTTRWGSDPAEHHISYYGEHIHRNERRYSLPGESDHVFALISRRYPETPSVLMGFTPFYLDHDTADLLIDFIMGNVFEIDR